MFYIEINTNTINGIIQVSSYLNNILAILGVRQLRRIWDTTYM